MQVLLRDMEARMQAAADLLTREFAGVRTGRASTALLDALRVESYGTLTPISQIASLSVPDPKTLVIQPWDVSQMPAIEKAILKSDLGLTPASDGKVIRLNMPTLTEERRKQLAKTVGKLAEDARVAIRNVRREEDQRGMSRPPAEEQGRQRPQEQQPEVRRGRLPSPDRPAAQEHPRMPQELRRGPGQDVSALGDLLGTQLVGDGRRDGEAENPAGHLVVAATGLG